MKIALVFIMFIHGIIHVMGFVKAFHFAAIEQLKQPISKLSGMFWLIGGVLFLVTAILYWIGNKYWWLIGLPAVLISQILVIYFWSDAKFGTLANGIVLLACLAGFFAYNFYSKYESDTRVGLQQEDYFGPSVLTEQDMEHLPEPVKKYLRYTGSVGKPKVNHFKVEFEGKIRKDENSEWMTFTSEQHNFMHTPTRLFFMKAVMKQLPVAGYHCYFNGKALMDIRLFSLIKVQYMDGAEMNTAETVTFFNDMCCMAPPTLIDQRIKWEDKGNNLVKAIFTNNGISITADLYFNDEGQLINFKSDDRYNADAGKRLPWATPLKNYKSINGYTLAGSAETIYSYADKEFCYGTFETKSVSYNVNGK